VGFKNGVTLLLAKMPQSVLENDSPINVLTRLLKRGRVPREAEPRDENPDASLNPHRGNQPETISVTVNTVVDGKVVLCCRSGTSYLRLYRLCKGKPWVFSLIPHLP
jgi:hypothetical protein